MRLAICIDADVPSELLRDSLVIGQALVARGHSLAYVVGNPMRFVDHAGGAVPNEIYQAPIRDASPLTTRRASENGLTDRLAASGFEDKQTLLTLTVMWRRLIDKLQPEAIIGFYCPIVWLVAPAYVPTFAVGNGLALPPTLGTSFPRVSPEPVPVASEEQMLTNANAALTRVGQSSIAALSDLLDRCISILYGISALDPYLRYRKTNSRGLLGHEPKPIVPPASPRIAAFLDAYCPNIETIVLAIAASTKIPFDLCVAGASTGMRRFLEQHEHITIWHDYANLLERAANASVLVHHGFQDVAQRCLTLGRPELIFPWTPAQYFLDHSINWMGFTWTKSTDTSIDDLVGTFEAVLRDTTIAVSAQHHAKQLADFELRDALPEIVSEIERARVQ